jgi:hypothetical protein
MSAPPALPPAPTTPSKNTLPCILLGCGALLLLGILIVGGAAFWYFSTRGESSGGSQAGSEDLGFGAKLSQYEKAGGSASVITPDGTWHAVFQERSDHGKPVFVFHRFSRDHGVTWSAPENISNDGTGNGAGFPKMARDAQGNVYAAWIRFGGNGSAVTDVLLDGPGGYQSGTLTLRRWSGGHWGPLQTLGTAMKVASFCFFKGADGAPHVLWMDEAGALTQAASGTGNSGVVAPAASIPADNPNTRPSGLSAVTGSRGNLMFTAERKFENMQQLVFWSGGQVRVLASDPKYETRNTFHHPAQLFADRGGQLHVVYLPNPKMTERQQLWDIDPASGRHQVIFEARTGEETIQSFQVTAENGVAQLIMEWSAKPAIVAQSTELVALSFNGTWSEAHGLTGNSRAEKFFFKDMPLASDLSMSTKYHARHASVAMDADGKPHVLGTIEALYTFGSSSLERLGGSDYKVTSIGNVAQPSLYVIKGK